MMDKGVFKGEEDNAGVLISAAETMLSIQDTEDQKMVANLNLNVITQDETLELDEDILMKDIIK